MEKIFNNEDLLWHIYFQCQPNSNTNKPLSLIQCISIGNKELLQEYVDNPDNKTTILLNSQIHLNWILQNNVIPYCIPIDNLMPISIKRGMSRPVIDYIYRHTIKYIVRNPRGEEFYRYLLMGATTITYNDTRGLLNSFPKKILKNIVKYDIFRDEFSFCLSFQKHPDVSTLEYLVYCKYQDIIIKYDLLSSNFICQNDLYNFIRAVFTVPFKIIPELFNYTMKKVATFQLEKHSLYTYFLYRLYTRSYSTWYSTSGSTGRRSYYAYYNALMFYVKMISVNNLTEQIQDLIENFPLSVLKDFRSFVSSDIISNTQLFDAYFVPLRLSFDTYNLRGFLRITSIEQIRSIFSKEPNARQLTKDYLAVHQSLEGNWKLNIYFKELFQNFDTIFPLS